VVSVDTKSTGRSFQVMAQSAVDKIQLVQIWST
jgi:hypothetical protein